MDRKQLREMFGGQCAYCGKPLGKIFHADHVAPIYRGWTDASRPKRAGKDVAENLFPACPRCNIRKATFSVEDFRDEISMQLKRLRRDSSAFNLAEDFGIISETGKPVVFWFEKYATSIQEEHAMSIDTVREAIEGLLRAANRNVGGMVPGVIASWCHEALAALSTIEQPVSNQILVMLREERDAYAGENDRLKSPSPTPRRTSHDLPM